MTNPAPKAAMADEAQRVAADLRRLKLAALIVCGLMVTGIVGLMVLSAGKGEDITGIVAPALLITIISGIVAIVAAVMQKRAERSS
jgi:hypothetical protein